MEGELADVFSDTYWEKEFDVTQDDLARIEKHITECGCAIGLTDLARSLVVGRLKHGEDISPSVLSKLTNRQSVRLWDPAARWNVGDGIIVIRNVNLIIPGAPVRLEAFIAEVIKVEKDNLIRVRLDERNEEVTYQCQPENHPHTKIQRENVRQVINEKFQSTDLNERAQAIILRQERVSSRLRDALEHDPRFLVLENQWFLNKLTKSIPEQYIIELHQRLIKEDKPASPAALLSWLERKVAINDIGLFSLHAALLKDDRERFKNEGMPSRPIWRAIKPSPPPWNQAVARYYSYDPTTYRILTRPGERINQRTAERLQALNLYADLVERAPSINAR